MTAFVEAHEIQLSFDFQAVMKSRKPRVSGRKKHSINRKTTALDLLEHEEWTGDDIALLHMKLLERSIDDLRNNRIKVREKAEIMEWIKEEKMPGQRARPFSFIKCCEYSGLDPDEMRDQLMDYLAHYFNKGEFVPAREDEFGCITHATATH